MSGSNQIPVVDLLGTSMSALILAIPQVAARTGRGVIVIGGLAVVCRLTSPYRATSDLDTVNRRTPNQIPQLQLLIDSGATPSGPSGALVPTDAGPVQVDVLEVTDTDLSPLPDDPTDRLHVLSHAWAAATATPVVIRATDVPKLTVAVAEPGALIAMKLQSLMNRGAAKEGTDLLDITRLSLDPVTGPLVRTQLAEADAQLRSDAVLHTRRWFNEHASRSIKLVQAVPEGRQLQIDDLRFVGELLEGALTTLPL